MMKEPNKMMLKDCSEISTDRHGVIEASAGTGKTYTIEKLVLRILDESVKEPAKYRNAPVQLEQFLIVTYTEKAAGELRKRIRSALEEKITTAIQAKEECVHFEDALSQLDNANISTIHGFCKKMISSHAFENNTGMGLELASDEEGLNFLARQQIRKRWTKSQQENIREFVERVMELDGRSTIDELLVKAAEDLLSPNSKFMPELPEPDGIFDYVEKLDDEYEKYMTEEAQRLIKKWKPVSAEILKVVTSVTPKKNAEKILEVLTNLTKNAKQIVNGIDNKLFSKNMYSGGIDKYPTLKKSIEDFSVEFDALKNCYKEYHSRQDKIAISFLQTEAKILAKSWEEKKSIQGSLSFDDMIRIVAEAVEGENSLLRSELQKMFRYGIIDEFQDTNPHQWTIFRNIFLDEKYRENPQRFLYVVGDPKQSIYGFQGADVNTYMNACEELLNGFQAQMYELNRNFRSTPMLIEACNSMFQPEGNFWFHPAVKNKEIKKEEVKIQYSPVQAGRALDSKDMPYLINDKTDELKNAGEYILNNPVITHFVESKKNSKPQLLAKYAQWVANEIPNLIQGEESPVLIRKDRNVKPLPLHFGNIAILVQKRKDALYFITHLKEKGIPVSFYKQEGIFQSEECLHLITLLRAVADPGYQDKNVISALITFFFNWSTKDVVLADRSQDDRGHFEMISRWKELADKNLWAEMMNAIQRETRICTLLALMENGDRKLSNYKQITNWFLDYCYNNPGGLMDHLLQLEALFEESATAPKDQSYYARETRADRVQIMTMHASKGLEFPVVFAVPSPKKDDTIYGAIQSLNVLCENQVSKEIWVNKRLPEKTKSAIIASSLEEYMRLSYVAFTRAGLRLYIPLWVAKKENDIQLKNNQDLKFIQSALDSNHVPKGLLKSEDYSPPSWSGAGTKKKEPIELNMKDIEKFRSAVKQNFNDHKISRFEQRKMRQTSYSNLVHHSDPEENLEGRLDKSDEIDSMAEEISVLSEFSAPMHEYPGLVSGVDFKGNDFGNVLHEVIENINFKDAVHPESLIATPNELKDKLSNDTLKLVEFKFQFHNLGHPETLEQRCSELLQMLCRTLSASFTITSSANDTPIMFQLGRLEKTDYLTEAEFHFPFDRNGEIFPKKREDTTGEIAGYDVSGYDVAGYDVSGSDNVGRDIAGYVKGFVDLTFRVKLDDGSYRYHVLDWKTTTLKGYDKESLQKGMNENQYDKQAMLYTLALHHWLKKSMGSSYDPNVHLGLPCYVFTRGVNLTNDDGFWVPQDYENWSPEKLKETLSHLVRGYTPIQRILNKAGEDK